MLAILFLLHLKAFAGLANCNIHSSPINVFYRLATFVDSEKQIKLGDTLAECVIPRDSHLIRHPTCPEKFQFSDPDPPVEVPEFLSLLHQHRWLLVFLCGQRPLSSTQQKTMNLSGADDVFATVTFDESGESLRSVGGTIKNMWEMGRTLREEVQQQEPRARFRNFRPASSLGPSRIQANTNEYRLIHEESTGEDFVEVESDSHEKCEGGGVMKTYLVPLEVPVS